MNSPGHFTLSPYAGLSRHAGQERAAAAVLVPKLLFGNAVRETPVSRLTPRPTLRPRDSDGAALICPILPAAARMSPRKRGTKGTHQFSRQGIGRRLRNRCVPFISFLYLLSVARRPSQRPLNQVCRRAVRLSEMRAYPCPSSGRRVAWRLGGHAVMGNTGQPLGSLRR